MLGWISLLLHKADMADSLPMSGLEGKADCGGRPMMSANDPGCVKTLRLM
jgi:hypothetical protein